MLFGRKGVIGAGEAENVVHCFTGIGPSEIVIQPAIVTLRPLEECGEVERVSASSIIRLRNVWISSR